MSAGHDGSLAAYTRITLRPIGSPLPLGLLALMCASVLLSLQQVEAFGLDQGRPIALIMIGFVVPLMLVATIFSFLARDTVAGTALGLFAGAWLATSLVTLTSPAGQTSPAFGAFLFALAAAMLVLIAGASFGKAGPAVVIVFGAARFLVTGLYEVTDTSGIEHAAGVIGFALALAALYSALATAVEDVQGEVKLPMGRRAKARDALEAPFDAQLDRLEHEAGIRQQL
jgi:succinate-acetate transporter protein